MNRCVHWWVISEEGRGVCRECGGARTFLTEITKYEHISPAERRKRRERKEVAAAVREEMGDALDDLA